MKIAPLDLPGPVLVALMAAALLAAGVIASISGCVTVYISFPEAEVEEAAEKIIEDVRPEIEEGPSTTTEPPEPRTPPQPPTTAALRTTLVAAMAIGAGPAAQEDDDEKKIKIDIDDPIIKRIRATLRERYKKLLPFYKSGALGERLDGMVEPRTEEADLDLRQRRELEQLVKAENRDRLALYKRIVEANEGIRASDLKAVQRIFGKKWIEQAAEGWWIQVKDEKTEKVEWVRKPKAKKKK